VIAPNEEDNDDENENVTNLKLQKPSNYKWWHEQDVEAVKKTISQ
jgi:hypothetical protein